MKRIFRTGLAVGCLLSLALAGLSCSSGGGGGALILPPSGGGPAATVTVGGTVDPNSVTITAKAGLFERFLAFFSPISKSYAVATPVDRIIAVSPGEHSPTIVEATHSGNDFSLDLEKGKSWVIAMLNGPAVVGIYKATPAADTDMDSLPISDTSTDIDLGTVTLAAGEATGSTSSASLYQALDITAEIASAIGFMDDGMRRHSNVDVDGNGTRDYEENKWYNLQIGYQLRPTETFAIINGAWSDRTKMVYTGFTYYVGFSPVDDLLDWSGAVLHSPSNINGGNDVTQCYKRDDRPEYDSMMVNFYCNQGGGDPPAGEYTITIPIIAGGNKIFTYKNVKSQHVAATLNNIYFPEVKLTTDGSGKVTLIEWRWVKRLNDGVNWTTPNAHELQAVLDEGFGGLGFEIGDGAWNSRVEARGTFASNTGSVVPAAQSFTPSQFAVSYTDKSGYAYHIEWNP